MKKLNISHSYNVDLWNEGVTDAKGRERAWIHAALNPIRQTVSRSLHMKQKNFRLSTAYIVYCDLLEKSRTFLNAYENGKREVLFCDLTEGGDWARFAYLTEKYGLLPLSAMPDEHGGHTTDALSVVNNRLRLGAMELDSGTKTSAEILSDITEILNEKLGTPPEAFALAFMTTAGEIVTLENLTAHRFMEEICCFNPADYTELPYSDMMKTAVAAQLCAGEQVVISADIRHQSNAMLGILDRDFTDNTDQFGSDVTMARDKMAQYGLLQNTGYYLSLDGMQLENGVPVRFKAQDSRGAEVGADGHYTMSDAWFDAYVLTAVIHKKYLSS